MSCLGLTLTAFDGKAAGLLVKWIETQVHRTLNCHRNSKEIPAAKCGDRLNLAITFCYEAIGRHRTVSKVICE